MVNGASPGETLAALGGGSDACAFITSCTDKDPDARASAAAALAHPFVAGIDERAGCDALQAWVQAVWRGAVLPTPGQHPARTAKARIHPVLERRKSAGDIDQWLQRPPSPHSMTDVVLDAVAPPPFDHSGSHKAAPPPVAARQQRRGGGALPGRGAHSAPTAFQSNEDASSAPAEKHRAAEMKMGVADKKGVSKMEVPAILGEGSLDTPRGMLDLLTALKAAILVH